MRTVFFHIPKTAGTTLLDIISRNYNKDVLYKVDGLNYLDSLKQLELMNPADRDRLEMICGHRTLDVHTLLKVKPTYISFFRDPVDQFISNFFYTKRTKEHKFYDIVRRMKGIEEFMEFSRKYDWNNDQTRHLSGVATDMSFENVKFNQFGMECLAKAKANLDTLIDYPFLTEEFDIALIIAKHKLNWINIHYESKNVTEHRRSTDDYSQGIIGEIKELQKYDIMLYAAVLDKYQKIKDSLNIDYEMELNQLALSNKRFKKKLNFNRGVDQIKNKIKKSIRSMYKGL